MDDSSLISLLQSLAQLEIDACHCYRRVVHRIDDSSIREQLTAFWRDHDRHVDELSAEIHRLGGKPPEFERDAKGIVIERFTALRASTGRSGALRALKTNERLTNAAYAAALREALPEQVRAILERNRDDERRHFSYVRDLLTLPEHRGPGLGRMVAGVALVTAGTAAAVWAISRWRSGARQATSESQPEPAWLVRKAPPGAPIAEAPDRPEMSDFGDEAQYQQPGEPPNLALRPRRNHEEQERSTDRTATKAAGPA